MNIRIPFILLLVLLIWFSGCSNNRIGNSSTKLNLHSSYNVSGNEYKDNNFQIKISSDRKIYSLPVANVRVILENTGKNAVAHSEYRFLEKLEGEVWYQIPYVESFAFSDIGLVLEPGNKEEQKISLEHLDYELKPGTYRIVKAFHLGQDAKEIVLGTQFQIEE